MQAVTNGIVCDLVRAGLHQPLRVGFGANQSFIDQEVQQLRESNSGPVSLAAIKDGVVSATGRRVRPVVMTAVSTMAGLVPIRISTGTGSDVTHRIAAPMLGGMLTVLILNLLVLPVLYSLVLQWQESHAKSKV